MTRNEKIMSALLRTSPSREGSLWAFDIKKEEYLYFLSAEFERKYQEYNNTQDPFLRMECEKIKAEHANISTHEEINIEEEINQRIEDIKKTFERLGIDLSTGQS